MAGMEQMDKNLVLSLWIIVAALLSPGCGHPPAAPKEPSAKPPIDFNQIVRQKDVEYQANPFANTRAGLLNHRIQT
jgi:hypothetical protein